MFFFFEKSQYKSERVYGILLLLFFNSYMYILYMEPVNGLVPVTFQIKKEKYNTLELKKSFDIDEMLNLNTNFVHRVC
jgi:hypothetical protein